MTMQTDVVSKYTAISALIQLGRTRLKGVIAVPTAVAGSLTLFDTNDYAAPRSITYGRDITTGLITVTDVAHGFSTGAMQGFTFAAGTGGTGTSGNYQLTVTGVDTYTLVDVNGVSAVTAGAAGKAAKRWITTIGTETAAVAPTMLTLPGEGVLVYNGIYALLTNLTSATLFHG